MAVMFDMITGFFNKTIRDTGRARNRFNNSSKMLVAKKHPLPPKALFGRGVIFYFVLC